MKRLILIIFLFILFFSLIPAQTQAGLVPCGAAEDDPNTRDIDESQPCQLCHFFVMFERIIRFLLFDIVPPLAILMIVIGGVMFMFAHFGGGEILPGGVKGGPTLLGQAKRLMSSVIISLIIIYGAWVIINTFFQIIGVATWEGWSLKEGWWKIECPIK